MALPAAVVFLQRFLPILRGLHPGYIKTAVLRLLVLFCACAFALWYMSVVVMTAGLRYNATTRGMPPLPDLGFGVLSTPDFHLETVPNLLLPCFGAATIVRVVFNPQGIVIMRRFFFLWMFLMFGRSSLVLATAYPDPSDICKTYVGPQTEAEFWKDTIYNPKLITCGDCMFSGHTMYYFLMAFVWHHYAYFFWERIFAWLAILPALFFLLLVRFHYLVDILVAMYITTLVWSLYHLIAEDSRLRKKFWLIAWLEADIIAYDERKEAGGQHTDEDDHLRHTSEEKIPLNSPPR